MSKETRLKGAPARADLQRIAAGFAAAGGGAPPSTTPTLFLLSA